MENPEKTSAVCEFCSTENETVWHNLCNFFAKIVNNANNIPVEILFCKKEWECFEKINKKIENAETSI